jgi:hypothetical protein
MVEPGNKKPSPSLTLEGEGLETPGSAFIDPAQAKQKRTLLLVEGEGACSAS